MKKLLLTTALIAISSSAFANTTATVIRDSLNKVYDTYDQVYDNFTHDSAHGEYRELLWQIDNIGTGTGGLLSISGSDTMDLSGVLDSTPGVGTAMLGDLSRDPNSNEITIDTILAQVEVFITQLETETVADGGFVKDHLDEILRKLDDANDAILATVDTAEQDRIAKDFTAYYNGGMDSNGVELDSAKEKFNSTIIELGGIALNASLLVDEASLTSYTLGADHSASPLSDIDIVINDIRYSSYTDWILNNGTPNLVSEIIAGRGATYPASWTRSDGGNTLETDTGTVYTFVAGFTEVTVTNVATGITYTYSGPSSSDRVQNAIDDIVAGTI